MLISVVIPFYRELDLIGRAVASVLLQRLPSGWELEIIIGNDGKFSEAEIRSNLPDFAHGACKVVKNTGPNGAGNARNVAIDTAGGDWIAFLDADDYWVEGKLEKQILVAAGGANFVATGYKFEGSSFSIMPPVTLSGTADLLRKLRVSTSSVLVSRNLIAEDRFENLRFSQDTEYWARLAGKAQFRFGSVPEVLALYAPSGRTANKFVQAIAFRAVVKRFKLRFFERKAIYTRYAVRGVFNHYLLR